VNPPTIEFHQLEQRKIIMSGEAQDSNWPLPSIYFSVDIGSSTNVPFLEVSGLDIKNDALEYRHGNSPVFSTIKMPGMVKNGSVTLKKGIFAHDNSFWDWYDEIKLNTIERQNVVIKLLDENGNPTMTWTLYNAWPTEISGPVLNAMENKVAIETMKIVHEGLTISNG